MWRLSGELAVNCSTLVDLPRQTHGLRWMRDELMAPPNRRLTLNGADDVQHWRQTLSGRTSILALFHSSSRAPAHTTYTGCVVVPAASVSPSEAVSHGRICGHLLWGEQPIWLYYTSISYIFTTKLVFFGQIWVPTKHYNVISCY